MVFPKEFEDFRKFLYYVWRKLGLPNPTPLQYKIANVIQNILKASGVVPLPVEPKFSEEYPMLLNRRGEITSRLLIEAYRGIGKSWINGTAAAWALGWNKDLNILAISAAKVKSDEFTTFVLNLIKEIPELRHLTPDKSLGDRSSALGFDVRGCKVAQAPSVKSVGVFGQITGSRSDITFADDIEVPKTSETQLLREKLAVAVQEIGGAIGKPETGVVIYLGTPQCEESLYEKLHMDRGYNRIIYPARYPSDRWLGRFGSCLEPSIMEAISKGAAQTGYGLTGQLGASTDPQRFNEDRLQDKEIEFARSGFALQFQLDTSLSDAERYPLRLRDLVVMDIGDTVPSKIVWNSDPGFMCKDLPNVGFSGDHFFRPMNFKAENLDWLSLNTCAMYIDPSGRGKDELALAVGYACNGYIFLKYVKGFKHGYEPETLRGIANIAKQFKVKEIITEPNFGDGMFDALLAPVLRDIYPCTITPSEWTKGQKEARIIDTLEPVINQHFLVVDPQVIRDDREPHQEDSPEIAQARQLFYQMTRITREKNCLKHDDRLDALAGLVNYFMRNLGVDQEETALERKIEVVKGWIAEIEATDVFNKDQYRRPTKPSWLSFGNKGHSTEDRLRNNIRKGK